MFSESLFDSTPIQMDEQTVDFSVALGQALLEGPMKETIGDMIPSPPRPDKDHPGPRHVSEALPTAVGGAAGDMVRTGVDPEQEHYETKEDDQEKVEINPKNLKEMLGDKE